MYRSTFQFEQDYADTLRLIPMAVRFKLDQCGIRLSLRQWSHFAFEERKRVLRLPCDRREQIDAFRRELEELIQLRSTEAPEYLPIEPDPPWADASSVPQRVVEIAVVLHVAPPSAVQWAALSPLERFTLLKLSRNPRDNGNFIPAMREFGLLD
jgi:hypothetical protein